MAWHQYWLIFFIFLSSFTNIIHNILFDDWNKALCCCFTSNSMYVNRVKKSGKNLYYVLSLHATGILLYFLHDQPWISRIKSISNELDIIIHVIASQMSGHCDVISNRLWHHQQSENRANEKRGRFVKIVVFIVVYGSVMSCKKRNNVCTLVTNCFCAHSSVILVFISLTETVRHSSTYTILYFSVVIAGRFCSNLPGLVLWHWDSKATQLNMVNNWYSSVRSTLYYNTATVLQGYTTGHNTTRESWCGWQKILVSIS